MIRSPDKFRRIVVCGDSVAAAQDLTGNGWCPYRVARNLGAVEYFFEAASGRTLATVATNIATYITNHPTADSCIIHAGTNDFHAGGSLAAAQTNLQTIMTYCESNGIYLGVTGIIPSGDAAIYSVAEWDIAMDYNAWAEQECISRGHVFCNPQDSLLLYGSDPEQMQERYTQDPGPDQFHLNELGALTLGAEISAKIIVKARLLP